MLCDNGITVHLLPPRDLEKPLLTLLPVSRPDIGCLPKLVLNFDAILSSMGHAFHDLHLITGVYQRNVSLWSDTHLQLVD